MDVQVVSTWDGEASTHELARLRLVFPVERRHNRFRDWVVKRRAERHVQEAVDAHFGRRRVRADADRIDDGSVVVWVALITPVAAFTFVKDYPKFREGLAAVAATVKSSEARLQKEIARAEGSPIQLIATASAAVFRAMRAAPIIAGIITDQIGTAVAQLIIAALWALVYGQLLLTTPPFGYLMLITIAGVVMTAVGGFTAGTLADRYGLACGFVVGMGAVAIAVATWSLETAPQVPPSWRITWMAFLLPAGLVGGAIADFARSR